MANTDQLRQDTEPNREIPKKKLKDYEMLFNATHYEELRAKALEDNVRIVHVRPCNTDASEFTRRGGATAAVGRNFDHGKYAKMSVAICSHSMDFNKKLGGYLALKAYYEGAIIPLFLGGRTPCAVAASMLCSMLYV